MLSTLQVRVVNRLDIQSVVQGFLGRGADPPLTTPSPIVLQRAETDRAQNNPAEYDDEHDRPLFDLVLCPA